MHGTNPVRPPLQGDGLTLDVQEIFDTFQGEGPFAGVPAIFIRLGGCNLACDFCDAEFESFQTLTLDAVLERVTTYGIQNNEKKRSLIVITGGEPMRQPLLPLCDALLSKGYNVQIETNGTLHQKLDKKVTIVCSPKNTGTGYKKVRKDLLPHITAFKFILSSTHEDYRSVPDVGQYEYNTPVYVQPMDEYNDVKNKANLNYAKDLALRHNYILSIQLQKVAGVK